MKKITEITVETTQVTIIRRRGAPLCAWCTDCAETTPMITAEHAAELTGLSVRATYREVERGRFHFVESLEGWIRLCLNSVLKVSDLTSGPAPQTSPRGQTFLLSEGSEGGKEP